MERPKSHLLAQVFFAGLYAAGLVVKAIKLGVGQQGAVKILKTI